MSVSDVCICVLVCVREREREGEWKPGRILNFHLSLARII